jgi:hypothetical protein
MSRRQRQHDELHELCHLGAVNRAIDLAIQHFVEFGPDDVILALLADALDRIEAPSTLRRRFAELRSTAGGSDTGRRP